MKLYHGSHIEVKNPKILTSSRVGDFGRGFYTTNSLKQARPGLKSGQNKKNFLPVS